jgi:hypothetical protein
LCLVSGAAWPLLHRDLGHGCTDLLTPRIRVAAPLLLDVRLF